MRLIAMVFVPSSTVVITRNNHDNEIATKITSKQKFKLKAIQMR